MCCAQTVPTTPLLPQASVQAPANASAIIHATGRGFSPSPTTAAAWCTADPEAALVAASITQLALDTHCPPSSLDPAPQPPSQPPPSALRVRHVVLPWWRGPGQTWQLVAAGCSHALLWICDASDAATLASDGGHAVRRGGKVQLVWRGTMGGCKDDVGLGRVDGEGTCKVLGPSAFLLSWQGTSSGGRTIVATVSHHTIIYTHRQFASASGGDTRVFGADNRTRR